MYSPYPLERLCKPDGVNAGTTLLFLLQACLLDGYLGWTDAPGVWGTAAALARLGVGAAGVFVGMHYYLPAPDGGAPARAVLPTAWRRGPERLRPFPLSTYGENDVLVVQYHPGVGDGLATVLVQVSVVFGEVLTLADFCYNRPACAACFLSFLVHSARQPRRYASFWVCTCNFCRRLVSDQPTPHVHLVTRTPEPVSVPIEARRREAARTQTALGPITVDEATDGGDFRGYLLDVATEREVVLHDVFGRTGLTLVSPIPTDFFRNGEQHSFFDDLFDNDGNYWDQSRALDALRNWSHALYDARYNELDDAGVDRDTAPYARAFYRAAVRALPDSRPRRIIDDPRFRYENPADFAGIEFALQNHYRNWGPWR